MNRTGHNRLKQERLERWARGREAEGAKPSRLPTLPLIPRAVLCYDLCSMRDGSDGPYRWYAGEIRPGMVFAWEPELPYARELCVVTRITGPGEDEVIEHSRGTAIISGGHEDRVWTKPMPCVRREYGITGREETWNEISRFREAVVPTLYKDMPA